MDVLANKAIIIGVSLFITIAITSGIIAMMGQVKNIYKDVYKTDISIQDKFSEYDKYDNTTKTGIDMLNTAKKYKDSAMVSVYYSSIGQINNANMISRMETKLSIIESYSSLKTTITTKDDFITITFTQTDSRASTF